MAPTLTEALSGCTGLLVEAAEPLRRLRRLPPPPPPPPPLARLSRFRHCCWAARVGVLAERRDAERDGVVDEGRLGPPRGESPCRDATLPPQGSSLVARPGCCCCRGACPPAARRSSLQSRRGLSAADTARGTHTETAVAARQRRARARVGQRASTLERLADWLAYGARRAHQRRAAALLRLPAASAPRGRGPELPRRRGSASYTRARGGLITSAAPSRSIDLAAEPGAPAAAKSPARGQADPGTRFRGTRSGREGLRLLMRAAQERI